MKKMEFVKRGTIILGVNGWREYGHDASATLIEVTPHSCKLLGALEEEKVSRNKCAYDTLPVESIKYLLNMFQLNVNDIDHIAFGWNYPQLYEQIGKEFLYQDNIKLLKELFPNAHIQREIPISFIDHHLAHAACSYRTSSFRESLIFVFDGQGEKESSSIWIGQSDQIKLLEKIGVKESLGYLYEAVNKILNFQNHESGKTMGLASYGKPRYFEDFKRCFNFKDGKISLNKNMNHIYEIVNRFSKKDTINHHATIIAMWEYFITENLGIKLLSKKSTSFYDIDDIYKDLAASVQALLESIAIKIVNWFVKKKGISEICMSGGVALNCIMNGEILQQEKIRDIFINPAANDAGVSLGAALELAYELGFKSRLEESHFDPFIGIEFTNEEIIQAIDVKGLKYTVVDSAEKQISELIANGKVVAVFQGRNEWGPRALGNRSILSSAREKDRLDYINSVIKERELGRPLGPSLLIQDSNELLLEEKSLGNYMNVAYRAKKNLNLYPAVIHVDHTFRPEFVIKRLNENYYKQLWAIKNKTGSSLVINTSFNLKTPIIFHIEDAIEYFIRSAIDALVFNNQIVLIK
ncbi:MULTISPECIES: carbamoyltransferase C-terminal domain-containing protein [unclassified Bacillus (in: firmicutes)]|uniref:carbamoyltransferase C-terminal domain-containing protein n=1 Tax=unclassified Bacillus (in: firmicutes) TaxID=185979 RepID=UPI0002597C5F|nr:MULTISPECIES: carbamoyltransferase C-terminal domain-containing protein [unclassified Bacillus (in: firmicutes)]AFI27213.1 nodulation protein nolNO [Bacillus sp. JS]